VVMQLVKNTFLFEFLVGSAVILSDVCVHCLAKLYELERNIVLLCYICMVVILFVCHYFS